MAEVAAVGLSFGASLGAGVSATSSSADGASSLSVSALPVRNPRIVQDPAVGFITQYTNAAGDQVLAQAPSAIAVAYLRQGLSASGMPKDRPEVPVSTTV